MLLVDKKGEPFSGTPAELKKHNDKLRKQDERANQHPAITLRLPPGTAAALADVMARAGFTDPRDMLAFQIHRLASLDSPDFDAQAKRTVRVTGLGKYLAQIGGPQAPTECAGGSECSANEPCQFCVNEDKD
jgi:hypothetical protein